MLVEQLKKMKEKGQLPEGTQVDIDGSVSAIENFRRFNNLINSSWRPIPISPVEHGSIVLSEYELSTLLWKMESTRCELRAMMDGQFSCPAEELSQADLTNCWLPGTPPGTLVSKFLADVDIDSKGLTSRQKGKAGLAAAIKLFSMEQIHHHINSIRHKDFDPRTYRQKGYLLLGSFRTDGHRLQLLAYKMKELLSARYKRYEKDRLPDRHLSTIAGVDSFLTEVRNVFKTPEDVKNLLGCWPYEVREQVNVLGIDPGQAFVVGASAVRPKPPAARCTKRSKRGGSKKRKSGKRRRQQRKRNKGKSMAKGDGLNKQPMYYNLAVKQKAIMQPTLKFRRWMERQKQQELRGLEGQQGQISATPEAAHEVVEQAAEQVAQQSVTPEAHRTIKTISDIETSIPPLRGQHANIALYREHRDRYWQYLDRFYNTGRRFKRFRWFARRAKEEEYRLATDSLLRMVDGCLGAKRKDGNKVIIGIGLGKFSSKTKLSSLHESFQSYFVQKVFFISLTKDILPYYI